MADPTQDDPTIAAHIKRLVAQLNAAARDANRAGLSVRFGTATVMSINGVEVEVLDAKILRPL